MQDLFVLPDAEKHFSPYQQESRNGERKVAEQYDPEDMQRVMQLAFGSRDGDGQEGSSMKHGEYFGKKGAEGERRLNKGC